MNKMTNLIIDMKMALNLMDSIIKSNNKTQENWKLLEKEREKIKNENI